MTTERLQRIALVCCRGGSTRIPAKNIKPFCGRPLLAWLLEALAEADCFDRIILSTDSVNIADVGRTHGAEVPGLRPAHLATADAVQYDTHRYLFDLLGLHDGNCRLFNPLNNPFVTAGMVRNALQIADSCSWRCVVRDARRIERDDAWFSQLYQHPDGTLRHRFPEDFLAGPQNRQQETRHAFLCPGRFIACRPSMAAIIRDAMRAADSCSWRCVVRDARRIERDDAWFSQLYQTHLGYLRHRFPEDFLAGPQNRQQETRIAYLCHGRFVACRPSVISSYPGYKRHVVANGILPCWWPADAPDLDLHEPADWPLAEAMFRRAYPGLCEAPPPVVVHQAHAQPTMPWGVPAHGTTVNPYEPILTS